MALSEKQRRFIDEYLIDFNGKQAAIRAGYAPKSAEVTASKLLRLGKVRAALDEAQRRLAVTAAKDGITAERVLMELARIGFADIRNVVKWRANVTGMAEDPDSGEQRFVTANEVVLIDAADLSDDAAAAIAEISQTAQGGLKVKLYDKRAALVDLGRHLGLFQTVAKGKSASDDVPALPPSRPDPDSWEGLLN